MTGLRSLLFNIAFFCWSAIISMVAVPSILVTRSPALGGTFARSWAVGVFALLRVLCGVDYRIRGLENLPDAPCIVAAKHQSAWDTMVFTLLLDNPSYVLKRELLQIPFFGWALAKSRMVPVDRAAGAKALKRMVAEARSRLAEGRSIVIFPQGTRVTPGAHRPYLPGVAALYRALGVPVVPVGLNSGLFWGRRSFLKKPGRILLELSPPIAPGLPRREFMKQLEEQVEGASNRLIAETGAKRLAVGDARGPQTKQER
jgi:1-acyl-sn-glycerol-3-phosphate acyltransferase